MRWRGCCSRAGRWPWGSATRDFPCRLGRSTPSKPPRRYGSRAGSWRRWGFSCVLTCGPAPWTPAAGWGWRNLAPGGGAPAERLAVVLTLLVPLSLTWATVIHRIFDFRVAVRAAVTAALLGLVAGAIYVAGELATVMSLGGGVDYGGVSLGLIGLD